MSSKTSTQSIDTKEYIVWSEIPDLSAPLVAALRQSYSVTCVETLADIADRSRLSPESHVLLFYAAPAENLCRAMTGGITPSVALKHWLIQIEMLLQLNRNNRRQVRLQRLSDTLTHPAELARQFHLPPPMLTEMPNPSRDEVLLLIAQRVLSGSPQTQLLLKELDAASSVIGAPELDSFDDPDAAFNAIWKSQQVRRDNDQLQLQLRTAQQEMVSLIDLKKTLERELQTTKAELNCSKQEAEQAQAQAKAARDSLLTETVDKTDLRRELTIARQEIDLLQARNSTTQQELT